MVDWRVRRATRSFMESSWAATPYHRSRCGGSAAAFEVRSPLDPRRCGTLPPPPVQCNWDSVPAFCGAADNSVWLKKLRLGSWGKGIRLSWSRQGLPSWWFESGKVLPP
jgi:hypothetical protein